MKQVIYHQRDMLGKQVYVLHRQPSWELLDVLRSYPGGDFERVE